MSPKTVLLVDDEPKIVEVLKSYFENAGYAVIVAYDGVSAMSQFEKHAPTLIVLDLMLPDMTGENICRIIRQKSRVPIMMLTAKIEEESILRGLHIGADDYITKPFSPRQVIARAEAILRRVTTEAVPLSTEISFFNEELVINCLRQEVRKDGELVGLTPNEYKILMTFIKYPQKTFTRDELITFALGNEFEGYDRVIDTHIKNIRQKIELDSKNPKYILTVHGIGYKFGQGGNGQ